jgi:predicted dinucleotide-binding enzyme
MNIAILGGTGKEGAGLATRWALAGHAIIIGSRDATRAHDKAVEMRERTKKLTIVGKENVEAAALGDVVVVALPATGLAATLPPARDVTSAAAAMPSASVEMPTSVVRRPQMMKRMPRRST